MTGVQQDSLPVPMWSYGSTWLCIEGCGALGLQGFRGFRYGPRRAGHDIPPQDHPDIESVRVEGFYSNFSVQELLFTPPRQKQDVITAYSLAT